MIDEQVIKRQVGNERLKKRENVGANNGAGVLGLGWTRTQRERSGGGVGGYFS